jgi:hypothetical protein
MQALSGREPDRQSISSPAALDPVRAVIRARGSMSDERHLSEIIVGSRHRKDMGDIEALAASIRQVGLCIPSSSSQTAR